MTEVNTKLGFVSPFSTNRVHLADIVHGKAVQMDLEAMDMKGAAGGCSAHSELSFDQLLLPHGQVPAATLPGDEQDSRRGLLLQGT